MNRPKKAHFKKPKRKLPMLNLFGTVFLFIFVSLIGVFHFVRAYAVPESPAAAVTADPNFHVKTIVSQFFEDNNAPEMIPIIACESNFKQFEADGTPLKNKAGSSALGVAQIMSSQHPDPKIVTKYNRRFDMDMSVEDFDLATLEGNLGYALVLYKIRGTRDWECGQKFSF